MTEAQIKAMQARIKAAGFDLGEIDGFWGRRSIAACQAYIRSLMPKNSPWPTQNQAALQAVFGSPGDESQLVRVALPFPMYYEGKLATHTRVHRKVADSLLRILTRIGEKYRTMPDVIEEAEDYGGVYNNRPMRGGSLPSLHARGAAIDLDADDNGNKVAWPTDADMPLEIIEEFSREGWTSAAVWWGRDAMHFQATQP
jgi:hypothetical protein